MKLRKFNEVIYLQEDDSIILVTGTLRLLKSYDLATDITFWINEHYYTNSLYFIPRNWIYLGEL